jgi:hypothetical protein
MRSRIRKAAWPSLTCQTVGFRPAQRGRERRRRRAGFPVRCACLVAAVEAVGDFAVLIGVLRQPGVEQDEADVADLDLPELGLNGAAGNSTGTSTSWPSRVEHRGNRQVVEIRVVVGSLLMPSASAFAGSSPDGKAGRHRQRAGPCRWRLAVVAGENAEAAGVDRQAFMEAEFGAEVGDQVVVLNGRPWTCAMLGVSW